MNDTTDLSEPSDTLVMTSTGEVRGTLRGDGTSAFLGVPYAAAPVGALRFEPPAAHEPWGQPFDAREVGATAPQREVTGPMATIIPSRIEPGDDYLNLNVWTPDVRGSLPVMVFIHGGSWTSGAGSIPGYDGTRFARHGVVLVTINYRLGSDGFAWFGEGPANLGLLDQIAALEWVRGTIAAFGGDPSAVTVFGESAGAMSIGCLLAMPAAQGLFHRAIMESGATHHAISPGSAVLVANRLADILGVAYSREALATVPREKLLAAEGTLAAEVSAKPRRKLWGDVAANGLPFEPVIDGVSLPALPIEAVGAGVGSRVEVLVGNNAEEGLLLFAPTGRMGSIKRWLLYAAALRVKLPAVRAVRAYTRERPAARPVDLLSDMLTDWVYRIPAMRLAEAKPGTFVYEFAWRSPAFGDTLGSCHGVELPFVFDNLQSADWAGLTGGAAPQALADDVHAAWIAFAATGDPGWRAYSPADRAVQHFGAGPGGASELRVDARPAIRELWAGRR